MFIHLDYSKPGKQLLVELINESNKELMTKPLNPDMVIFSKPVKQPKGSDVNTSIRITAISGFKGWEHPVDIEYNRIDINQLKYYFDFDGSLFIDILKDIKETKDLLPFLYNTFKVYLDETDIVNEKLELDSTTINSVKLQMSDDCIAYHGVLCLNVSTRPIRIDTAIRNTNLGDGLKPYHFYSRS